MLPCSFVGGNLSEIKLDLSGLKKLQGRGFKNLLKKATRAGAAIAVADMRAAAAFETGALKKSIASKVDGDNDSAFAVVGPRTKYTFRRQTPARYAHLTLRKANFLEAADSKAQVYLDKARDVLQSELHKGS